MPTYHHLAGDAKTRYRYVRGVGNNSVHLLSPVNHPFRTARAHRYGPSNRRYEDPVTLPGTAHDAPKGTLRSRRPPSVTIVQCATRYPVSRGTAIVGSTGRFPEGPVNETTLVAAVALGLGLLLAAGGSVVLAHARAAVRADRPPHRSVTQFPAALSALLGFLLTSVSGAVLCWRVVPERGATAVLAAIVVGVILFALVGASFARVADRVEDRRLRHVPDEVHRPISPPPRRPALTAAPASAGSEPRSLPAVEPPALPRPRRAAESAPFGYATPLVPVPPRPMPAVQATPDASGPATAAPDAGAGSGADHDETSPAPKTHTHHAEEPSGPGGPEAAGVPAASRRGDVATAVEAAPMTRNGPRWGALDAGWIYHDEAEGWFLAVGAPDGSYALLGLPSFALVDPDGPDAPVGTLRRAGAAELTVLPDEPEAADPPLTDENRVNDPRSDDPHDAPSVEASAPPDPGEGELGKREHE